MHGVHELLARALYPIEQGDTLKFGRTLVGVLLGQLAPLGQLPAQGRADGGPSSLAYANGESAGGAAWTPAPRNRMQRSFSTASAINCSASVSRSLATPLARPRAMSQSRLPPGRAATAAGARPEVGNRSTSSRLRRSHLCSHSHCLRGYARTREVVEPAGRPARLRRGSRRDEVGELRSDV